MGFFYRSQNSFGLNFRVVKYSKSFHERIKLIDPEKKNIGYIISAGYNNSIEEEGVKKMVISYCPFCGADLKEHYTEEYVQEMIDL